MPISDEQQLMERKCVLLIKIHDTSLLNLGYIFTTCVSRNKHPDGPWWELRCITYDHRNILIKKGPSAPGRTRFHALKLLYRELLNMPRD